MPFLPPSQQCQSTEGWKEAENKWHLSQKSSLGANSWRQSGDLTLQCRPVHVGKAFLSRFLNCLLNCTFCLIKNKLSTCIESYSGKKACWKWNAFVGLAVGSTLYGPYLILGVGNPLQDYWSLKLLWIRPSVQSQCNQGYLNLKEAFAK